MNISNTLLVSVVNVYPNNNQPFVSGTRNQSGHHMGPTNMPIASYLTIEYCLYTPCRKYTATVVPSTYQHHHNRDTYCVCCSLVMT